MVHTCTITIDYKEMPGSPVTSGTWSTFNAMRTLRVAWADRHVLAKELIGYRDGGNWYLPHEYEAENSNQEITGTYAQQADLAPIGGGKPGLDLATGLPKYAILTVTYGVPEYDIANVPATETFVTESLEPVTEFGLIPHKGLYWADNTPLNPSDAPGHISRMTDWVYTLHQTSTIPDAWLYLQGGVNDANVYSRRFNRWFATETLLAGNPTMQREVTSTGAGLWSVTFRFTHKNTGTYAVPLGWNHFPQHGKTGAATYYSRIRDGIDGDYKYFYPLADFSSVVA